MVPRRVPEVGTKEITLADGTIAQDTYLKSFDLSHYAIMLTEFQLDIECKQIRVDSTSDYNKFLPLGRMKPFFYEKFKICSTNDNTYKKITTYEELANYCTNYSTFFENSHSGNVCKKEVIISNKEHYKDEAYELTCSFRFRFDRNYS